MQTIRYRGASDRRIITSADFLSVGITAPTAEWNKGNGYELVVDDLVAAYALSQGEFEAGDPDLKFGKIFNRAFVNVPAGWGDIKWDAAKLLAASQRRQVHMYGDSLTFGAGSTVPRTDGLGGLVAAALASKWGNAGTGWIHPEYATKTGSWTSRMGMGGCCYRASAAASLEFPFLDGTKVNIWYRNAGITGSFRYQINGGGFTTVTPPTAFSLNPGIVEIQAPTITTNGPHLLRIEWVSGNVDIFGVEAHRATGMELIRFAQGGRAGSDFGLGENEVIPNFSIANGTPNATVPSPGSFRNKHVGRYVTGAGTTPAPAGFPAGDVSILSAASAAAATLSGNATAAVGPATVRISANPNSNVLDGANLAPLPFLAGQVGLADLLIFSLGANDPAGTYNSPETLQAGLTKILMSYKNTANSDADYTPDIIVVAEHIGTWFDVYNEYPLYVAGLENWAAAHNAAFIDLWGMGKRSHEYWDDLGYFADQIHLTTAGYAHAAQPLIDLITQ